MLVGVIPDWHGAFTFLVLLAVAAGLDGVSEGLAVVCLDLGIVAADDLVHRATQVVTTLVTTQAAFKFKWSLLVMGPAGPPVIHHTRWSRKKLVINESESEITYANNSLSFTPNFFSGSPCM